VCVWGGGVGMCVGGGCIWTRARIELLIMISNRNSLYYLSLKYLKS